MIKPIITTALALGFCLSAAAQGSFKVQTSITTQGIQSAGSNPVTPSYVSGSGFFVTVLVNGTVRFDSQPAVFATFGRINNQTAVVTPGVAGGLNANFEVRVWTGAASYVAAQTTPGASRGTSGVFSQLVGGDDGTGNSTPVLAMTSMPGFTLVAAVPEPSSIALAGLGLGGLVLARRSKKA